MAEVDYSDREANKGNRVGNRKVECPDSRVSAVDYERHEVDSHGPSIKTVSRRC